MTIVCALAFVAAPLLLGLALQQEPVTEQVLRHLRHMRETQTGMMNVAAAEGEYLADLVRRLEAKRVLEIGTSNGYSGIWLALGLRETGGRLLTLEIDEERHRLARENFAATGVEDLVDLRLADALEVIPRLEGPFDLVFLDAWKGDYLRYLEMILPKVRSGGVIVAHNVISHADELEAFVETVRHHPSLETEIVREGPAGLSVSTKR